MLIAVDRERCIGSGNCVVFAAGTFSQDEEAKVIVLEPIGDDASTIRIAVEACPTQALSVRED